MEEARRLTLYRLDASGYEILRSMGILSGMQE